MPATLLTLPAELRNRIYAYVLPSTTQEVRFSISIFPPVPPMLQVSRQPRNEGSGLYWQHCSFDIVLHHRTVWQLRVWIDALPREASRYLLDNHNLNLRVVLDEHHEDYEKIKHSLFYCIGTVKGWYMSGESPVVERLSLERMVDIALIRAKRGAPRAADTQKSREEAQTAFGLLIDTLGIPGADQDPLDFQRPVLRHALAEVAYDVASVMEERCSSALDA